MSALEKKGLYMEGIYRKPGAAPKVKELKAALEAGMVSSKHFSLYIFVLAIMQSCLI